MKYICSILVILAISFPSAFSQQNKSGEIGIGMGVSYYLGDYNKVPFKGSRFSAGGFYRHNFDTRYALRVAVNYIQLYGNSNSIPSDVVSTSFSQNVYDLNIAGEFNFIPFLPINKKYTYTPYVLAGVGIQYLPNGEKEYLLAIPFGLGIKYNLNKSFCIAIETSFYKTFSDYVDVSYQEANANSKIKQQCYEGNNDWYSIFGIKLTYKIKYKMKCPAFD